MQWLINFERQRKNNNYKMKYSTIIAALISPLLAKGAAGISLKQDLQNQDASKVYDFDFHGGVFLSTSEVNKDFCDPDSVSLSGYFGCEFHDNEDQMIYFVTIEIADAYLNILLSR
jgi:hypothetical protein